MFGYRAEEIVGQSILKLIPPELHVEEEPEILQNAGFDAIAAYDRLEALGKASRFHPDWILADVLMPRMNGVELAIAIRKNHLNAAILLL